MKSKKISPAVSFYDGAVAARDIFIMCGKLDILEDDDYSHSRNYSFANNNWGGADLPFMTTSICMFYPKDPNPAPRAMCTLAQMAGCVDFYWSKGVLKNVEMLPGARENGGLLNLQKIAQVGDDLYVVGAGSQVYRRAKGAWSVYNEGLEAISTDVFLSQGKITFTSAPRRRVFLCGMEKKSVR